MPRYGILKSTTNTGTEDELLAVFTAPLSVTAEKPSFQNDTANLRRVTIDPGLQRWRIRAGIYPTNNGDIGSFAHMALQGHTGVFPVRVPQPFRRKPQQEGAAVTVASNTSAGATSVVVTCATLPEALDTGFVRFMGHAKVYLIVAATKAGNNHTLTVTPPIKRALTAGEVMKYGTQVTMQCSYDTDTELGLEYEDGIMTKVKEVTMLERD